jgi:hypothetical protein
MRRLVRQRSDPLIPILGTAVTLVCLGAVLLVFYPRISSMMADRQGGVVRPVPADDAVLPLWVCRTEEGVALLIEPAALSGETTDAALDGLLGGGPYHYLKLSVYNFGRAEAYRLELPAAGFDSPEGGPRLVPTGVLVPEATDLAARRVLHGLGAVRLLEVPPHASGQALLAVTQDVSKRTGFVSGTLRFERREITRLALAQWHDSPALKDFLDF